MSEAVGRLLVNVALIPVRVYQRFVSPLMGRRCKYEPTCSRYAVEALRSHGVVKGSLLASWRILRCNPFSNGGYDPVERQRLFGRGRHSHPAGSSASAGTGGEA
jgi:putative membrane protein insertion efficiency factor